MRSIRRRGSAGVCSLDLNVSTSLLDRIISCPYCAETMSILIDLSAGGQTYIEDCQICCQPMQISFEVNDEELVGLRVECGV